MPDRRTNVVRVVWGGPGRGTVIKGIPAEDLHPFGTGNILPVTPSPSTENVRLFDQVAQLRPGYTDYATKPTVSYSGNSVTGITSIQFKTGNRYLLRAEATGAVPSGTHTGGLGAASMTDSTATFGTNTLIGSTITNVTDGSSGTITANTDTNVTATLSGGTDNWWDTNDVYTISSDTGRIFKLNDSASPFTWSDITGGTNLFTGTNIDWWTWAVAPIAGTAPNDELLFFCNGNDAIYQWTGTGNVSIPSWTGTAPVAPKVLISYLGRLIAMNYEDGAGNRLQNAIQYSVVGESRDWTGRGAGTLNLSEDVFPIVKALVLGGRLCLFKGDEVGGSIVVGTPTGISTNPIRFDTVQAIVGVIIPQSVVQIGESLAFFMGHDAFYLYDGARTMRPFAQELVREIVSNLNINDRESGFAVYHPIRREILLGYARRGSKVPDEFWWIDPFNQRVYGPHYFTDNPTSGEFHIPFGGLTWNTLDGRTGVREWDTLQDSTGATYGTWDDIIDPSGATGYQLVYGFSDGETYADNGEVFNDNGTAVVGTWTSPAITPMGLTKRTRNGSEMELDPEDVLTLRSVTLRYRDYTLWYPIVQYSTDGGSTWTTISDGAAVGSGSDRVLSVQYRALATGKWFQFRVRNTSERFGVHSLLVEMTRSGSFRHT